MHESEQCNELDRLRSRLRQFAADRDWDQFHSPKNLAIALSVEASELLEHFQWIKESESSVLSESKLAEIRQELGDVLLYLVRLSDKLDIDLASAAHEKIDINAHKYPIEKSKGSSRKYSEL